MNELKLAVILVSVDGYFTVRKVINEFKKQEGAEHLELIIVTTTREQLGIDEDLTPFFGAVKIIEQGTIPVKDEAIAAGIRAAASPAVVLAEDHAYPRPGWAKTLMDAHQGNYGGVSPAVANANPKSMYSWANYLMSYAAWYEPPTETVDSIPLHNSSFKREILMEYNDRLEKLLNRDSNLNSLITNKGGSLLMAADAVVDHVNVSTLRSTIALRFNAGRFYAASRSKNEGWNSIKRLIYTAASPLYPIIRLRIIQPYIKKVTRKHKLGMRLVPALTVALLAHAAGEAYGYLFGFGDTLTRLMEFEYNRHPHLNKEDQRNLTMV